MKSVHITNYFFFFRDLIILKIIILYQIIKKLEDLSYVYPVTLTKIHF